LREEKRDTGKQGAESSSIDSDDPQQTRPQDDENQSQASAILEKLTEERGDLQEQHDSLLFKIPAALIMKERPRPRPAHILVRGEYDQPGELVERKTPGFLPPMSPSSEPKSRMDLAYRCKKSVDGTGCHKPVLATILWSRPGENC
jgi:hypothetical protein